MLQKQNFMQLIHLNTHISDQGHSKWMELHIIDNVIITYIFTLAFIKETIPLCGIHWLQWGRVFLFWNDVFQYLKLESVLLENQSFWIMNCWCQGSKTISHIHILDIYWYPNKFQFSDHKVVNNISCRSESSNISLVVRVSKTEMVI